MLCSLARVTSRVVTTGTPLSPFAESLAEEFDAAGLFEEPLRFTQRFVTFRKKVRPKQVPFPLAAENDAQDALRALGA